MAKLKKAVKQKWLEALRSGDFKQTTGILHSVGDDGEDGYGAVSTKLKPEVKAAWLEALRSGNYRQGRTALHESNEWGDTYCCLGVLCEVALKQGLGITSRRDSYKTNLVDYDGSISYLPGSVYEWATEEGRDPCRNDFVVPVPQSEFGVRSLSALNDDGREFDEIAALIEEHL